MLKIKIINHATNDFYETRLQPKQNGSPECIIGRHPSCDLVLDGPTVSRVHGRILFQEQYCYFADLGSTDGSRLNNEEVTVNHPYVLTADDVIRLGEFVLLVESIEPNQARTALSIAPSSQDLTLRCAQIIQETPDVKTFRFQPESTSLFTYKPGQFVTFSLEIEGRLVQRSYSLSSSPSHPYNLEITVKRVPAAQADLPPGLVSNWLHDALSVGQTVQIRGPFGQFTCADHPADNYLLISAGSGITPMMSMVQWLYDMNSRSKVVFIHSARTAADLIFRQRLESLAAQNPQLELAWTLTQSPKQAMSVPPWTGYRGRLGAALLSAIVPNYSNFTTFVCGPQGFMSSTKALFESLNFPMQNYFEESFGGPKTPQKAVQNPKAQIGDQIADQIAEMTELDVSSHPKKLPDPTIVVFADSGKEVTYEGAECLLELAEQVGISLKSGCRMGSCGVCKQKLLSGNVDYVQEPVGLSVHDRENDHVLVCVAQPVGRVVLSA